MTKSEIIESTLRAMHGKWGRPLAPAAKDEEEDLVIQTLTERLSEGENVLAQREMEKRRSPLVSIPPFGRGFSRHRGLSIRWRLGGARKSPHAPVHRLDEPSGLSLGMVASLQCPLPFRPAGSL
jgi:hypothetical protein